MTINFTFSCIGSKTIGAYATDATFDGVPLDCKDWAERVAKAALDAKSLAAAILRTTSLGATAAANIAAASMGTIAKIRSYNEQLEGLGSSSIGATVTPQLIDSTPYTYTRTLQTAEEIDEMNKPIYVKVTDIEDGLEHKVRVTDESSF